MRNTLKNGFTLVELLVVVAIIVVLLAMLVPSMQRAVYQAELVSCGSRLKAVTSMTLVYAHENKRFYPDRTPHKPSNLANLEQPARIAGEPLVDDWRPMLTKVMGDINKFLNCPLTEEVDYIAAKATEVYTSYNIWVGWGYTGERMRVLKIGDELTFKKWRSNQLFGDRDLVMPSVQDCQSAHPDSLNKLYKEVNQDRVHPYTNRPATVSWWISYNTSNRGTTDDNFAYDDGSVIRLSGIEGAAAAGQWDDRVKNLPVFLAGTGEYSAWINVPK